MKLILLLVIAFVVMGVLEHVRHERALRRIPIRVHVNGTRGKSSVTRLIAAGLRAGGIRTAGKTTGSAARYIHPDGREDPIERQGPPTIKEQLAVVRQAVAEGAEALVVECMAIRPDLQAVSEERIIQSTIGVMTNVRPDHLEVMGPTLGNVALSLSNSVPRRGQFFSADQEFSDLFREVASGRGSRFRLSTPESVREEDLRGFPYVEHRENVCLALDVCEAVGVPRGVALAGMWSATPDVGALKRVPLREGEKEIELVAAFAANDPISTRMIWDRLGFSRRDPDTLIVLVNLRGDRMRRSKDLAKVVHRDLRAGTYALIGEQTRLFRQMAVRHGAPAAALLDLGGEPVDEVYRTLFRVARHGSTVVGIGNIGGAGGEFLRYVESRRGQG